MDGWSDQRSGTPASQCRPLRTDRSSLLRRPDSAQQCAKYTSFRATTTRSSESAPVADALLLHTVRAGVQKAGVPQKAL